MSKNPYSVLGISENATDEQVKSAYRELAKKYHPDNYQDSPLKDLATEKMKEINEAYDEVQRLRKEGKRYQDGTNSSGAYGGYGAANGYTRTKYPEVRSYIQSGRLDDAETLLRGVPEANRDAEWYFLYGMISYRRGWTDQAYNYFRTAYEKEPGNPEYRNAFNNMNNQRAYQSPEYRTVNNSGGCSACDMCSCLCCTDTCCECMGGDCIRCC